MKCFVAVVVLLGVTFCHAADRYGIVYAFPKGANEGAGHESIGPLIVGSVLYGATRTGGAAGKGTLFRIHTDGANFQLLHEFGCDPADGSRPCGTLVADDGTLYGMTSAGGTGNGRNGTIFRIRPDGSDYKILHHFEGWHLDGDTPYGSLLLDHGRLYGLTPRGGPHDAGVMFRINTDGTGFGLLYAFAGGTADGATPYGSLTADNDYFYGMTSAGGSRNRGIVFRLGKNGGDYKILHQFTGGYDNGSTPYGSLLVHGEHLYGMTFAGGLANKGTIFRLRKDGTGFTLLHSFSDNGSGGSRPQGGLVLYNGHLYGVTRTGGRNECGVLFRLALDGQPFSLLRCFADPSNHLTKDDVSEPYGVVAIHDNALYGLARRGGKGAGGGVFRYELSVP